MRSVNDFSDLNVNQNIDLMDTISYGFKKAFSNWKLWLVGSFLFLLSFFVLGGVAGFVSASNNGNEDSSVMIVQVIVQVLAFFITPFIIGLALHEYSNQSTRLTDAKKMIDYVNCLKVNAVLYLISIAVLGVIAMIGSITFLAPVLTDNTIDIENNATPLIGLMLLIIGLMIVSFFIAPLFMFDAWLAADKSTSIKESIVQGFNIGKKHYTTIILWYLTFSILSFILTVITLGLASIVIIPAVYLSQAYLYKQIIELEK